MWRENKFFYLLISLLLIIIGYPFFEGGTLAGRIFALFFSAVLITGVYAVSKEKRIYRIISFALAVPAILLLWIEQVVYASVMDILAYIFMALFCFFTVFCMISHFMKAKKVNANILAGAAGTYLLLGISWGMLFALLQFINSGSFVVKESLQAGALADMDIFIYYSFATLTTLGYGDVTPVSSHAQSLAILEAATGVLFIALLISRLVGMYLYQLRGRGE